MRIVLKQLLATTSSPGKWCIVACFFCFSLPLLLPLLFLVSFLVMMLLLPLGFASVGFLTWQRLVWGVAARPCLSYGQLHAAGDEEKRGNLLHFLLVKSWLVKYLVSLVFATQLARLVWRKDDGSDHEGSGSIEGKGCISLPFSMRRCNGGEESSLEYDEDVLFWYNPLASIFNIAEKQVCYNDDDDGDEDEDHTSTDEESSTSFNDVIEDTQAFDFHKHGIHATDLEVCLEFMSGLYDNEVKQGVCDDLHGHIFAVFDDNDQESLISVYEDHQEMWLLEMNSELDHNDWLQSMHGELDQNECGLSFGSNLDIDQHTYLSHIVQSKLSPKLMDVSDLHVRREDFGNKGWASSVSSMVSTDTSLNMSTMSSTSSCSSMAWSAWSGESVNNSSNKSNSSKRSYGVNNGSPGLGDPRRVRMSNVIADKGRVRSRGIKGATADVSEAANCKNFGDKRGAGSSHRFGVHAGHGKDNTDSRRSKSNSRHSQDAIYGLHEVDISSRIAFGRRSVSTFPPKDRNRGGRSGAAAYTGGRGGNTRKSGMVGPYNARIKSVEADHQKGRLTGFSSDAKKHYNYGRKVENSTEKQSRRRGPPAAAGAPGLLRDVNGGTCPGANSTCKELPKGGDHNSCRVGDEASEAECHGSPKVAGSGGDAMLEQSPSVSATSATSELEEVWSRVVHGNLAQFNRSNEAPPHELHEAPMLLEFWQSIEQAFLQSTAANSTSRRRHR